MDDERKCGKLSERVFHTSFQIFLYEEQYIMSSKKWIIMFFSVLLFFITVIIISNLLIDPFGVFGDVLFDWYSYDMTQNPKVAKIAYLQKNDNYKKYDSYIIGSSGASALLPEYLECTGKKFYNMFVYGADMSETRDIAEYLIKNYKVKSLILTVGFMNTTNEPKPHTNTNEYMHAYADRSSRILFYLRYLFANPKYAFDKIDAYRRDTERQQIFDVFIPETGCYDKSVRDTEPISGLEAYLEKHSEFKTYRPYTRNPSEKKIENCLENIKEIKEMCDENNIDLTVIIPPVFYPDIETYSRDFIALFYNSLGKITSFYDFSSTYISYDARYFYDTTHYRNAVGKFIIDDIFRACLTDANYLSFYYEKGAPDTAERAVKNYFRETERTEKAAYINFVLLDDTTSPDYYEKLEKLLNFIYRGSAFAIETEYLIMNVKNRETNFVTSAFCFLRGKNFDKKTTALLEKYGVKSSAVFTYDKTIGQYDENDPEEEKLYKEKFLSVLSEEKHMNSFLYKKGDTTRYGEVLLHELGFEITLCDEVDGMVISSVIAGFPQTLYGIEVNRVSEIDIEDMKKLQ